jgi:hypothetical protein
MHSEELYIDERKCTVQSSTVREKPLPGLAIFVTWGGLFAGSNLKSYGWLIHFYKILGLKYLPSTVSVVPFR